MRGSRRIVIALVATLAATAALADPGFAPETAGGPAAPPPRPLLKEAVLDRGVDAVNASDALDEMLDEVAADLARLGPSALSPVLVERVEVSRNVDPTFAAILEARLTSAVHRGAQLALMRCVECRATQTRVENGVFIVQRGLSRQDELAKVAKSYGARTVLRANFTLREQPDSLALDVELARAEDATIAFAEGYRFEPSTGLLYRGADSAQSRREKLADLEDRLERKPHFGTAVYFGAMMVPADSDPKGPILGGFGQLRFYEAFGPYRQHRVGLNVGGFVHSSRLAGGVLEATVMTRVTPPSLYAPEVNLGMGLGGFLTGGGGNTPMGTVHAEIVFASRLAVQASVSWVHPFDLARKGIFVGGVTPQAGMALVW